MKEVEIRLQWSVVWIWAAEEPGMAGLGWDAEGSGVAGRGDAEGI